MNDEDHRIVKTQWTARLNELRRMREYIDEKIMIAYRELAMLDRSPKKK